MHDNYHDLLTFKDSKYRRNPNKPHHNKKSPNPNKTLIDSISEREMDFLRKENTQLHYANI